MAFSTTREIPFNYTSADDAQIIRLLLGDDTWRALERLRFQRRTGRLAKLFMRFMGDMFILRRNPYIYEDLVSSRRRRRRFLNAAARDLATVAANAVDDPGFNAVIARCRTYLEDLRQELGSARQRRQRIRRKLSGVVGEANVSFAPFALISHATDATGWRLFLPAAVVRPGEEKQVPALIKAVAELGMPFIPRGGGTGLTGGCVAVRPDCVMINTEKLDRIRGIEEREFTVPGGRQTTAPVLMLEAGVITEDAIRYAAERNLVFATDPTSAWACTIGGNIAENAGGKTAVLWGTAIDNILAYRIAMPGGLFWDVRRRGHPLRKILPQDTVTFDIFDEEGILVRTAVLKGSEIRAEGLGKDITNKALNGLPGLQKEGTDGVITSAEFILHHAYPCKATFCLEFFGPNMDEAGQVIMEISRAFENRGEETLMALEHFDEAYVRAINYKAKAPQSDIPKAVLLIDMVGHNDREIQNGKERLEALLARYPSTFLFAARDPEEAGRFWQDRKKLGAIAARTNAFKLNEDIVLPLEALADFARFADFINIEEERKNQRELVWQLGGYLESAKPQEDPEWLAAKMPAAKQLLMEALERISLAGKQHLQEETHLKRLQEDLLQLFRGYERIRSEIEALFREVRSRLIVIATHMHAGDGNIHVNIPVFANDRDMMIQASETADAVMAKAVELGGVVSGEHGIGFTKFKYLDPERLQELTDYRRMVDPGALVNPGKLSDPNVPELVYTPSFNLLGLEAGILKHASLEALAGSISQCIRCGRCKADCAVFAPQEALFYHPRNRNLAVASLVEMILYETQRVHSTRLRPLRHLEEIADHCTICHKCHKPCPVNIDSGQVTILERELLAENGYKHIPLKTRMALRYLESRAPLFNALFRKIILQWGSRSQRTAWWLTHMLPRPSSLESRRTGFFSSPLQKPSAETLRRFLPRSLAGEALLLHPPGTPRLTVFYFPGCGSERLFADIAKASIYLLLQSGARVILPPPFLCCGYPARVNASKHQQQRETLRETIIFSQIRAMFGYLDFDACVVSCGTCLEALRELGLEHIFACRIEDVSRFALENGFEAPASGDVFYHPPCHDSLTGGARELMQARTGLRLVPVPHCCSEAGTLALSRPDISGAMLKRKSAALTRAAIGRKQRTLILTNCPSCLQGLGRQTGQRLTPLHLAVALARQSGGLLWEKELEKLVGNYETVVF